MTNANRTNKAILYMSGTTHQMGCLRITQLSHSEQTFDFLSSIKPNSRSFAFLSGRSLRWNREIPASFGLRGESPVVVRYEAGSKAS